MSISEQVKELRAYANVSLYARESKTKELLKQAANTIESLSAKLADMERLAEDCGGGWIYCGDGKNLPEKYTDCLIRYYNSKEGKRLTDIAWIDEYGDWQFTREVGGYFPRGFKKEITHWMQMPED